MMTRFDWRVGVRGIDFELTGQRWFFNSSMGRDQIDHVRLHYLESPANNIVDNQTLAICLISVAAVSAKCHSSHHFDFLPSVASLLSISCSSSCAYTFQNSFPCSSNAFFPILPLTLFYIMALSSCSCFSFLKSSFALVTPSCSVGPSVWTPLCAIAVLVVF